MFEQGFSGMIFSEVWPYGLSRNNQNIEWFLNFVYEQQFNVSHLPLGSMKVIDWSVNDLEQYYNDNKNTDIHINLILTSKKHI